MERDVLRHHAVHIAAERGNVQVQQLADLGRPGHAELGGKLRFSLLASDTMKAFVQQRAVGPFDWVVIDTPPVLAVTDAVILAPLVSGVSERERVDRRASVDQSTIR